VVSDHTERRTIYSVEGDPIDAFMRKHERMEKLAMEASAAFTAWDAAKRRKGHDIDLLYRQFVSAMDDLHDFLEGIE